MRNVITLLITLILCSAGVGAQTSWDIHTHNGEYSFARGNFSRAESEFQAALEIAKSFPAGDRRLETSLDNLGRFYENGSDFDKAQPLYQLMLAAGEHRLGPDSAGLLTALYAVARVSQPMGDLPTVVDSLERFTAIADATGKADPRQRWQVLQLLARTEVVLENQEQALAWQRRAAEVIDADSGATWEERADVYESAGNLELKVGDGFQAEQYFVKVGNLRREEDEQDAMPRTMAAAAAAAYAAGQFDTAERLAMRSVNLTPDEAAERQAREVLADTAWAKVSRGTDDLTMLSAAAGDSEDLVRARDRLRSMAVLEDGQNPRTLERLVQVEVLRGQPASAVTWQRQLLDLAPYDDAGTAKARKDLVFLLIQAQEWDDALAENTALLAELEAEVGTKDKSLLPVLELQQKILTGAGEKKQAKKVGKRIKKLSR